MSGPGDLFNVELSIFFVTINGFMAILLSSGTSFGTISGIEKSANTSAFSLSDCVHVFLVVNVHVHVWYRPLGI